MAGHCIGCIPGFSRSDGVDFAKGDWLEIDRGIGKFQGVWNNPTLGLTYGLSFYRSFENPAVRDSFFGTLGKVNGEVNSSPLDRAFKVAGPMTASGKRPARVKEKGLI